jgi:hypothetical protein
MDVNKNKILLKGNNYQRKSKEISLISPRTNNTNTNKIGLVININNQKGRYNRLCNSNDNQKNKTHRNNKTINEITMNCLERENSFLKKEIEIVKSNLIISDKREQINKKTIQEIKKMNKKRDNSYKNMINMINEYKTKEIDFVNKIKEIENESKIKEEKLTNDIYFYKQELINKDEIIKELNNKIEELNESILNLKKIINEKNRILLFLTKKNKSQRFKRTNSINNIFNARTMVSSKSCGNIISKIIDFKNTNNSSNIIRHNSKTGLKQILLNDDNNKDKNIKIIKKQSYIKKRIPNNSKKYNDQNSRILRKYYSNRNINEYNNNSLNYSLKNIEKSLNTNINISSNEKIAQDKINTEEIMINNDNIFLSENKRDKKEKFKHIKEIKNYSLILNDLEKHKNQIKLLKEIAKNKNINYCNTAGNKKSKPENMKGLYSQKNKLIEINKNFTSNPSFISNISFKSIVPSFQNK